MPIEQILRRSEELDDTIVKMLDPDSYPVYGPDRLRMGLSVTAASLSLEHARALRLLVAGGFVSSAVPTMRMQFEATTRSAWLLFAASDAEVALAGAPLTAETEEAARRMPMATGMIKELQGLRHHAGRQCASSHAGAVRPPAAQCPELLCPRRHTCSAPP